MNQLTTTELYDRIDRLDEATEKMAEVIELVAGAIAGLECEGWADAYVLSWLKILAGPSHEYVTRDRGIHDIRERIEEEIAQQREQELQTA